MRAIPDRLDDEPSEVLEPRGEVFMPLDGLREAQPAPGGGREAAFANPRNAAAGPSGSWTPGSRPRGPLTIFFYGVGEGGEAYESHSAMLDA